VNEPMVAELYDQFVENIWLQGALIAVGVCFLEDAGRCATGLLVAAGRVNWWWALIWMMIGSLAGDVGLYLIGRYAMSFCTDRSWLRAESVEKMKQYFARHALKALFGARFVPGARTVIFMTAGASRYRMLHFLAALSLISLAQILLFLYGTELVGERVSVYLADPRSRWMTAGVAVALMTVVHFAFRKRGKARIEKGVDPPL
jgi:membrane protein DedA with SNARE-associated domain